MEIIKEILSSRSGIQLAATIQAMCVCFMWEHRRERPWKVVFPLHICSDGIDFGRGHLLQMLCRAKAKVGIKETQRKEGPR